jgi:hypothetical protein
MKVLIGIFFAWAVAWGVVIAWAPSLWIVAALGFLQNVAFTFVSRGRNSGSLLYHMVASIFSNGIWLGMFVIGVKIAAEAPTFPAAFAVVYVLSTMAGSVFAHWLARKVEKGKARNVQEDRVEILEKAVRRLEKQIEAPNPLFLETVMRKLATLELLVKGREATIVREGTDFNEVEPETTLPERLDALEEAMRENVRQEGATSLQLGERLEKVEEKVRHLWEAATIRANYPETGNDLEGRIAWLERNVARLADVDIRGTVKMHLQPALKRIARLEGEV